MEMLSNGILDIEDTEGEEISLTAEGPQLTEEEKLRIESEDEEEGEKRIDLFSSEEGKGDPLNNLLLDENSPAIESGNFQITSNNSLFTDINGANRNDPPDLGAYQYID